MTLLTAAASSDVTSFVSIDVPMWGWFALIGVIVAMLLVDLLVVHREAHEPEFGKAVVESIVWIVIGLLFGVVMLVIWGGQAATEYYAGYVIEKSLSVDNVFVWAVIFSYFKVPGRYQRRVLFWGIFGALVMRFIFIFAGVTLLERFDWMLYVFGAILLFTAYRMAKHKDEEETDPSDTMLFRVVQRVVPSTPTYDGQKLWTRVDGRLLATPLFVVLIIIEATDVVFAVDSVPAILAISRETFIVFAANAFAILGLRALYFTLAGMAGKFRYLDKGLALVLAFVGTKMMLLEFYHMPVLLSLSIIAVILGIAIWLSLRADKRDQEAERLTVATPAGGEITEPDPDDTDLDKV